MIFDDISCNFNINDLNIILNNNLINRQHNNITNCLCGQPVHIHPRNNKGKYSYILIILFVLFDFVLIYICRY